MSTSKEKNPRRKTSLLRETTSHEAQLREEMEASEQDEISRTSSPAPILRRVNSARPSTEIPRSNGTNSSSTRVAMEVDRRPLERSFSFNDQASLRRNQAKFARLSGETMSVEGNKSRN